jgi:hypothetical protein
VPGIGKPVDGNRFNGTAEALVRFMSATAEQPAPPPIPAETIVISVATGTKFIINGREVVA